MSKSSIHPELAKRIHYACDKIDLPRTGEGRQRLIGKGVGVTQEAARKWLLGYSRPTQKYALKLADFLQVDIAWLEYGSEPLSVKKRGSTSSLGNDETVDGSFYYMFSLFSMKGIPVVVADSDVPEDLWIFNRGKQFKLSVVKGEEIEDKKYRAHLNRDLKEGTTVIVVVSHEFGHIDHFPLSRDAAYSGAKTRGSYLELMFDRVGRKYQLACGGDLLDPRIRPNKVFA